MTLPLDFAAAARAGARWLTDAEVAPLGDGHINDTYLLGSGREAMVLQRINTEVFRDPATLMRQAVRLLDGWSTQQIYQVPAMLPTRDGELWVHNDDGWWRACRYLAAGRTLPRVESPEQARLAARAFACFQETAAGLEGPPLVATIDSFLELAAYLRGYDAVAAQAPAELRTLVDAHRAWPALAQPTGPIHGDCKLDNLLFDSGGSRVLAVLDFDTAMHGHWAWDFGDLVRSVWSTRDRADEALFLACLEGFAAEREGLDPVAAADAPGYVTLMLAVRFLTDHLSGNRYFRVTQAGENLRRAQKQFELFRQYLALRDRLGALAEATLA